MDEVEKAIQKVFKYESIHVDFFGTDEAKKNFYDTLEEVKPILTKNQETKDEALKLTFKRFKRNYHGKNTMIFLLNEGANPTMIVDKQPIISTFLQDTKFIKVFIDNGFDVNAKIFPNDYTLLMEIIKRKHSIYAHIIFDNDITSIIEYIFNLERYDINVRNKDDETVFFFCLSNNYLYEAANIFINKKDLDYTDKHGNNTLLLFSKSLIETSNKYNVYDEGGVENNNDNFNNDDDEFERRREAWEAERNRRNWAGGALLFGQNALLEFYKDVLSKNLNLVNTHNKKGEYVLYYLTTNTNNLFDFLKVFLDNKDSNYNINLKTEEIPYTALYNSVNNNLFDSVNILLDYNADANIQDDETKNTPLHLAIHKKYNDIVRLLVPKTNLNIKNKDNLTPLELAIKNKNKDAIHIIKEESAIWKGSSKSDLEKYDVFFEKPFDWSVCPVCLEYVERADGCMFVAHDCAKTGHYYHKELYDNYKFTYGTTKIEWCSVCGRITEFHNHFKLTDVNANKPPYEKKDESILQRIERGENDVFFDNMNCKGLGGGGTEEKASRLRRLREYALELQDDVGKKKYVDAMKELIEEVWNAPLRREKKRITKILTEKKFNNNLKNLPNIIRENNSNNNSSENVNVEYDGELPIKLDPKTYNCYIGASENEGKESNPVYEFQHKNRNGIDHSNKLICKDDLEMFIENINKEFGTARFTKCFDLTCNALLYPQEIKSIISKDVYEEYRKKFNKKIRKDLLVGGKYKYIHNKTRKLRTKQCGGDLQHVLHKLENLTCYQPPLLSKKNKNTKSKRFTFKRNR